MFSGSLPAITYYFFERNYNETDDLDEYYETNPRYYYSWMMMQVIHAFVNGAVVLAAPLALIDSATTRYIFKLAVTLALSQPFGVYWGILAYILWALLADDQTGTWASYWQEVVRNHAFIYGACAIVLSLF